jgi:hypothetical protein
MTNTDGSAAVVVLDVTAVTSTPSLVLTILGIDKASGKTWTILTSAAIATAVTTIFRVGLGITPAAGLAVNDILPPVWQVVVTAGNANSATYSVGAHTITY